MATAKIQTVKGKEWRFFAKQKILLGLDGLDSRNGAERGLLSARICAILNPTNQLTNRDMYGDVVIWTKL